MLKAVAKAMQPVDREGSLDHVRPHYLETLTLVERLHRLGNGFQHDTFPVTYRCCDGEALVPSLDAQPTSQGLKSL